MPQQSDIFESQVAIVSGNQTMANILREQCVLYGFNNTHIFSDWDSLLPKLSEGLPDIIVADQVPAFHNDQTQKSFPSQMVFYEMIPVVLYSQSLDDSSQKIIPEGLTIVASLYGRDEQHRLLEVIHEELDKRFFDVRKFTEKDRFDVILTNPPFGGTEHDSVASNFRYPSKATSITFLQHIMAKVKRGGRVGMVIDEGVLFKTNENAYVQTKKELLEQFNLHTIVSLPTGVFANAVANGTGPKTNLLFFNRELDKAGNLFLQIPHRADSCLCQQLSYLLFPQTVRCWSEEPFHFRLPL